jgi:hypothetical protein
MIEILLQSFFIAAMTAASSNGEFTALVDYGRDAEFVVQSFTLYDKAHEVIYHKQMLGVHTFFITDAGSVFALNEDELHFYHQGGEEVHLQDLEYPNGFGFSVDNSLFFASDKRGIFAYSSGGELIHRFQPGRLYADADGGKSVAIISTDTLFLYDGGMLKCVKILSTPYARRVRFSDDSRSVIIEVPKGVEIIDVRIDEGVELE